MPDLLRATTRAGDGGIALISLVRERTIGDQIASEEVGIDAPCLLSVPFARFAKASEARPGEMGLRLVIEEGLTDAGETQVRIEGAELNSCPHFTGDRCHGADTGNMDYGVIDLKTGDLICDSE